MFTTAKKHFADQYMCPRISKEVHRDVKQSNGSRRGNVYQSRFGIRNTYWNFQDLELSNVLDGHGEAMFTTQAEDFAGTF
jgi:hypothetical protein